MSKAQGVGLEITEVLQLNMELITLQKEAELPFKLKYDLVMMYEKTKLVAKIYEEQRIELIKKYGKELKDKTFTLEGGKDEEKGREELEALNKKKELFNFSFLMDNFENLKSENVYIVIMKFIK
jgi:hypothetical protein